MKQTTLDYGNINPDVISFVCRSLSYSALSGVLHRIQIQKCQKNNRLIMQNKNSECIALRVFYPL